MCMTAGILWAGGKSTEVHAATGNFFDMEFKKGQIFDCDQQFPIRLKNQPYDASVGNGNASDGQVFTDQDMDDIYFKFIDDSANDPDFPVKMYVYWNKDKGGHIKGDPYTADDCNTNNAGSSRESKIGKDGFVSNYRIAFAVCNAGSEEAEGIFLVSKNGYGCYIAVDGKQHAVSENITGEQYTDMEVEKLTDLGSVAHKHEWSEWETDNDTHRAKCTACGKIKNEKHTEEWFTDIEATVDQEGKMHSECTVCGIRLQEKTISKINQSSNNFFDVQFVEGQIFHIEYIMYWDLTRLGGNPKDTSVERRFFSDQDMEDIYFQFADGSGENPNYPIKMYVYWNKDKGNYKRYTPYTKDCVLYNNADDPANAYSKIDADGFVGRFQIRFVYYETDDKVTGVVLKNETGHSCFVAVDGKRYSGNEDILTSTKKITIDHLKSFHLPIHMHMWSEEWTGDESNHWHKCIGKNCDGTVSDKGAHTESEWIIDREAALDEDGEKHTECTVCGRIMQTAAIPKTEQQHIHRWSEDWISDEDYHWHICMEEGCDGTVGDKDAHIESGWITDRKATSSREGAKHTECTVCRRVLQTAVIPKTKQYSSSRGASSAQDPVKTPEEDTASKIPESSQPGGPDSRSPKTGDDTPLVCLLIAMMLSAGIIFVNTKRIHY